MNLNTPYHFERTTETSWDVSVPTRGVIGRVELINSGRFIRSYRVIVYRPNGSEFVSGKPQKSVSVAANYIYKYWLRVNPGGRNA